MRKKEEKYKQKQNKTKKQIKSTFILFMTDDDDDLYPYNMCRHSNDIQNREIEYCFG